jgi:hypothetical protein
MVSLHLTEYAWQHDTLGSECAIGISSFSAVHHGVCDSGVDHLLESHEPGTLCRVLMFGSGIPTAAKPQAKKYYLLSNGRHAEPQYGGAWKNYQEYLASTSVLIPIPKRIYRPLPTWLKQTVLLDFPIYRFNPDKDGAQALEEE